MQAFFEILTDGNLLLVNNTDDGARPLIGVCDCNSESAFLLNEVPPDSPPVSNHVIFRTVYELKEKIITPAVAYT